MALRKAKFTFPETSKQLGLANPNTAQSFYNTYCKTGSLESKKRCGRLKKQRNQKIVFLLERSRKTILQTVKSFSVSSISSLRRGRYQLKTIRRIWRRQNSSDELLQRNFFIREKSRIEGLKWCAARKELEVSDWKHYCFSYECSFKLRSDGRIWV